MLNGPGFNVNEYPKAENRYVGRTHSKNLPKGRVMNWMRRTFKKTKGAGKQINRGRKIGHGRYIHRNAMTVLKAGTINAKSRPMNHLLRVRK
jgi:hypothetical protein